MSKYSLYFDGCSKRNPGPAGAGAVIYEGQREIWFSSYYVGNKETNNVAEYYGLLMGMEEAMNMELKDLHVYGDSQLVIKQMNNEYKTNSLNLIPLKDRAKMYEQKIGNVVYEHIYRKDNKRADMLANLGLVKETK